eukprot:3274271-Pleurochrysis_carterae.AAC.2
MHDAVGRREGARACKSRARARCARARIPEEHALRGARGRRARVLAADAYTYARTCMQRAHARFVEAKGRRVRTRPLCACTHACTCMRGRRHDAREERVCTGECASVAYHCAARARMRDARTHDTSKRWGGAHARQSRAHARTRARTG